MKFQPKLLSLCLSATLANTAYSAALTEETTLENVIVYGALTETPFSQMAGSISVLDETDIERRNAKHLESLFNTTPNVNFSTGASRGRYIQIRGIGERSQFSDPAIPSVGFIIDGIDYSGLVGGASTFDIEQVEIFKGPNSARFGAEGLAGMINMISTPADGNESGVIQAEKANFGSWHLGVAKGGNIVDGLNYRVSAHKNVSDGFINNTHLNRVDTNNIDELIYRAKLNWQTTDNLNIGTSIHHINIDNGYDAFSLDNNRKTLSDEPGFDRQKSDAAIINAKYQITEFGNIELAISHLETDLAYGYDEDWSFVGIRPSWEYSSTDYYFRDKKDNTIEIKLSSQQEGEWVIGAYASNKNEDFTRQYTYLDSDFTSSMKRKDIAIFAKYRANISSDSWINISARNAGQNFEYKDSKKVKESDTQFDWGAEFSFHKMLNPQNMFYASLTRSYKMGGVNGQALAKKDDTDLAPFRKLLLENKTFEPESLIGTEFGIKGETQEGKLTFDVALFYQLRKDVQYKSWIVQDQAFTSFINNAVDGVNYGLETSLSYRPISNVRLFTNIGLLKAELNDYTREVDDKIETLSRDQAHAPNYQINAGFDWEIINNLNWTVELDSKDGYFYSFTHDQKSEKITLLHTNISWKLDQLTVSIYARNLADKEYANRGFYFGNDPRDDYAAKLYKQKGEPRLVGINLRYDF